MQRPVSSISEHQPAQLTPPTEGAASNFFTPTSQKKPSPITWRVIGTSAVIGRQITGNLLQPDKQRRIAGFDLVGCLTAMNE